MTAFNSHTQLLTYDVGFRRWYLCNFCVYSVRSDGKRHIANNQPSKDNCQRRQRCK